MSWELGRGCWAGRLHCGTHPQLARLPHAFHGLQGAGKQHACHEHPQGGGHVLHHNAVGRHGPRTAWLVRQMDSRPAAVLISSSNSNSSGKGAPVWQVYN